MIMAELVKRFRRTSNEKRIIVTTHPPIILDMVEPSEFWVVCKRHSESRIEKLDKLDNRISMAWERGDFKLSEYLDSGLIPGAVPGVAA